MMIFIVYMIGVVATGLFFDHPDNWDFTFKERFIFMLTWPSFWGAVLIINMIIWVSFSGVDDVDH